jgi:hypothetical protein
MLRSFHIVATYTPNGGITSGLDIKTQTANHHKQSYGHEMCHPIVLATAVLAPMALPAIYHELFHSSIAII